MGLAPGWALQGRTWSKQGGSSGKQAQKKKEVPRIQQQQQHPQRQQQQQQQQQQRHGTSAGSKKREREGEDSDVQASPLVDGALAGFHPALQPSPQATPHTNATNASPHPTLAFPPHTHPTLAHAAPKLPSSAPVPLLTSTRQATGTHTITKAAKHLHNAAGDIQPHTPCAPETHTPSTPKISCAPETHTPSTPKISALKGQPSNTLHDGAGTVPLQRVQCTSAAGSAAQRGREGKAGEVVEELGQAAPISQEGGLTRRGSSTQQQHLPHRHAGSASLGGGGAEGVSDESVLVWVSASKQVAGVIVVQGLKYACAAAPPLPQNSPTHQQTTSALTQQCILSQSTSTPPPSTKQAASAAVAAPHPPKKENPVVREGCKEGGTCRARAGVEEAGGGGSIGSKGKHEDQDQEQQQQQQQQQQDHKHQQQKEPKQQHQQPLLSLCASPFVPQGGQSQQQQGKTGQPQPRQKPHPQQEQEQQQQPQSHTHQQLQQQEQQQQQQQQQHQHQQQQQQQPQSHTHHQLQQQQQQQQPAHMHRVKAQMGVKLLWVSPSHRRKGLARMMFEVARCVTGLKIGIEIGIATCFLPDSSLEVLLLLLCVSQVKPCTKQCRFLIDYKF